MFHRVFVQTGCSGRGATSLFRIVGKIHYGCKERDFTSFLPTWLHFPFRIFGKIHYTSFVSTGFWSSSPSERRRSNVKMPVLCPSLNSMWYA